ESFTPGGSFTPSARTQDVVPSPSLLPMVLIVAPMLRLLPKVFPILLVAPSRLSRLSRNVWSKFLRVNSILFRVVLRARSLSTNSTVPLSSILPQAQRLFLTVRFILPPPPPPLAPLAPPRLSILLSKSVPRIKLLLS
ncbi:hypothetical protein BGZ49_008858, partial [Haplosporangium sp. Z 27]